MLDLGKTMENIRKTASIEIINSDIQRQKIIKNITLDRK